jgi:hypothetical protein
MIVDYSIVNNEDFFILVVMRMTISLIDLAAGCPSGMGDSNCRADGFLGELVDKSFDAI